MSSSILPAKLPLEAKAFRVELVAISALRPNPRNARKHGRPQIRALASNIKDQGFINPLIIDGQMLVLAGHGRLEAAKLLGLREVPCIKVLHLTPPMARAYIPRTQAPSALPCEEAADRVDLSFSKVALRSKQYFSCYWRARRAEF